VGDDVPEKVGAAATASALCPEIKEEMKEQAHIADVVQGVSAPKVASTAIESSQADSVLRSIIFYHRNHHDAFPKIRGCLTPRTRKRRRKEHPQRSSRMKRRLHHLSHQLRLVNVNFKPSRFRY